MRYGGSELFVFQGGKETLARFQPIIFLEICEEWCKKCGYASSDIVNFITHFGYSLIFRSSGNLFISLISFPLIFICFINNATFCLTHWSLILTMRTWMRSRVRSWISVTTWRLSWMCHWSISGLHFQDRKASTLRCPSSLSEKSVHHHISGRFTEGFALISAVTSRLTRASTRCGVFSDSWTRFIADRASTKSLWLLTNLNDSALTQS